MEIETTRDQIAHLLRRFGLGASEAELEYYGRNGLYSAIDLLLNPASAPESNLDLESFRNDKGQLPAPVVQGAWYLRILATQRPLEEKMTIFWHNHFATSLEKVKTPLAMVNQIDTLREHALGKFEDLLLAVSKDPAMIFWLDGQENVRGKPNENFAREVMELFTVGIGNYTEHDIQESARAFTGWSFGAARRLATNGKEPRVGPKAQFNFNRAKHDDGEKTIFGRTGNLGGEDVLAMLCQKPETAHFITKKIWEFFVYEHPTDEVLAPFVQLFRKSNLDIAVLLRAIMRSDEFYSSRAVRRVVKNPIDFTIAASRALGAGTIALNRAKSAAASVADGTGKANAMRGALVIPVSVASVSRSMGMDLLYPPDVSGWKNGVNWISTATMVERTRFADVLFSSPAQLRRQPKGQRQPIIGIPAYPLLSNEPTPAGVVARMLSLFDVQVSEARRRTLIEGASSAMNGQLTRENASDVAIKVGRLLFSSPEFQFC